MRSIVFEGDTWEQYEALRDTDKRLHRNLCRIIKDMQRGDPATGIGKPGALKHNLSGLRSRRLSQQDRVIHRFDDESIYIFAIGGHCDHR
ncbi:Txe/YoeB family addiction module toxin [Thiocapsa sp.]|uniref:Txe/YoeB family addiction module toxin n=1 Tax=Thiocapsa sp. TaxID=2024551 RepID=UPI002BD932C5|nr:Txe/YoeB family addiction module toxin [Thiocapsa sp.]HSO83675.1 Txe/YoeB family addiction module toxin [Thiocapsa sp.]